MNIFKRVFLKKFAHNRYQCIIVAALLVAAIAFVVAYKPAYQLISDVVNDNLLLYLFKAVAFFIIFIIFRIYFVSRIKEGEIDARGCAGSSCLMTFVMFVLVIILSFKCCRHYCHPSQRMEGTKDIKMANSQKGDGAVVPMVKPFQS